MSLKVPWWGKILAKMLLSRLPFDYRIWQRLGLFRHGSMDQCGYLKGVFEAHLSQVGLEGSLEGKTVLELGPGDSIGTALVAASYGANSILLDAGEFAVRGVGFYQQLAMELANCGLSPPDLSRANTFEDVLEACHAKYLTNGLSSFKEVASGSVDLVISQAVLEHLRRREFAQTMCECSRVLKKNGKASHKVDLRDHLDGGLNNLRFSDEVWESEWFVTSGFYTNRLRCSEMIHFFKKAGFSVEKINLVRWNTLPLALASMNHIFVKWSEEELKILGFDVVLKL